MDGFGLSGTLDRVGGLGVDGVIGDLGGTEYGATSLVGGTLDSVGGLSAGGVSGDLGGTVQAVGAVTGEAGVHGDA